MDCRIFTETLRWVAIIGDNDPEWIFAQMGILSIGCVGVGLYVDSSAVEIKYILEDSGAKVVFAKDQEAVDKILSIAEDLHIIKVIFWDPKGLWTYTDSVLVSWEDLILMGQNLQKEKAELFKHAVEGVKPDDTSVLMYTSGTSGQPKAARYTHRSTTKRIEAILLMERIMPFYDEVLYVSPAWSAGQAFIERHLVTGHTLNFPENPETVQKNIREIAPHTIFYSSRLWEDLISTINRRINDSSWLNRMAYKYALKVGYKIADYHFKKENPNLLWKIAYALCNALVFRSIKDRLGLIRVVNAFTSGGSLGPESFRYLRAIGLNIKQAYGLAEAAVLTFHQDGDVKFESVGSGRSCDELAITEEGEIIVKGEGFFIDYYKNPELTEKCFTNDWFHTGDAGYIDEDGHLIFWDRLSDLKQLKSGAKFSPLYIESRLRFSHYIRDVMCIGGDREYVTILIAIDFENVGKWAERLKIPYTTFVDLSQRPEVLELIKQEVQTVNNTLPEWSKVMKLLNLPKEFDPDESELTRTRKLRRNVIHDRYKEVIEAMYEGKEEISTQVKVQYRDGTEKLLHAKLKIMSLL